MITTTITSRGQITIPKETRDQLNLHTGDKLRVVVNDHGLINLVPIKKTADRTQGAGPEEKENCDYR